MKTKILFSAAVALLLFSDILAQKTSSSSKTSNSSSSSKASTSSSKASTSSSKGSTSSSGKVVTGLPSLNITNHCEFPIWRVKNQTNFNVSSIVSSGAPYTDIGFPPNNDALYFSNKTYQLGILNQTNTKNIEWKRAKQVWPNATLFDTDGFGNYFVDPTDVKDDSKLLSESFFLGPLSASAQNPEEYFNMQNILNLFSNFQIHSTGLITSKVFIRGLPTNIFVDDFLPFISGTNKLAFAQPSKTGTFWSPFLEKVYAKVVGNYESIDNFYFG